MRIEFQELNQLIATKLQLNESFSLVRIDNTAGYVVECMLNRTVPSEQHYHGGSLVESGIYPTDLNYSFNVVMPKVIDSINNSDILGFVDCAQTLQNSPTINSLYGQKPLFFSHSFLIVDPGALLGYDNTWGIPVHTPWTHFLKNKKVLVVSTHYESIMRQWEKIDKVWGKNRDIIAPFDLVGCVRAPYHPLLDDRQYPNCNSWEDNVKYMINEIDKYDYDVLLSGSTTSSPIFVNHAKKMGKVGIQTGGTIQLFFGIYGYRWTHVDGYKNWHNMYNEHWIYPLTVDEPKNKNGYSYLETTFAYWSRT
jgi:hypothetical protein